MEEKGNRERERMSGVEATQRESRQCGTEEAMQLQRDHEEREGGSGGGAGAAMVGKTSRLITERWLCSVGRGGRVNGATFDASALRESENGQHGI